MLNLWSEVCYVWFSTVSSPSSIKRANSVPTGFDTASGTISQEWHLKKFAAYKIPESYKSCIDWRTTGILTTKTLITLTIALTKPQRWNNMVTGSLRNNCSASSTGICLAVKGNRQILPTGRYGMSSRKTVKHANSKFCLQNQNQN